MDLNHVQPTLHMIAFHFSRFIQIRIGSFLLASLANYQIEILGQEFAMRGRMLNPANAQTPPTFQSVIDYSLL